MIMKNKTNTMLALGLLMGNTAWAEQALQIAKPPVPQQSPALLPVAPAASTPASTDGSEASWCLTSWYFMATPSLPARCWKKRLVISG
jgi:hypothetical protein